MIRGRFGERTSRPNPWFASNHHTRFKPHNKYSPKFGVSDSRVNRVRKNCVESGGFCGPSNAVDQMTGESFDRRPCRTLRSSNASAIGLENACPFLISITFETDGFVVCAGGIDRMSREIHSSDESRTDSEGVEGAGTASECRTSESTIDSCGSISIWGSFESWLRSSPSLISRFTTITGVRQFDRTSTIGGL